MIIQIDIDELFFVVKEPFKRWQGIVFHCTVNPSLKYAGDRLMGNLVDRSHKYFKKWNNGMGYHILINGNGLVEVGIRWLYQLIGAHCYSFNSTHIGVAWVGDGDHESMTPEQMVSLRKIWTLLQGQFGLNRFDFHFHKETGTNKSCPGILIDKIKLLDSLLLT